MARLKKNLLQLGAGMLVLFLLLLLQPSVAEEGAAAFDHYRTGFELLGAHRDLQCESCHMRGQFAGTPRTCQLCHVPSGLLEASFQPADHIPTSGACDSCHDSFNWQNIARVDHSQLPGTCVLCHNGQGVEGKPPNHIPSGQQCEQCHSTFAWLPANFDHSGVTQTCQTCHNSVLAEGKAASHLPTSRDCVACHTTVAWMPANFSHTGITGNCQSCHNNTIEEGKPAIHLPTTQDCNACHSTLAWIPASFTHAGISSGCTTCHDGVTSTGKGQGHFQTTLDCNSCHGTVAWQPDSFFHTSPGYPGEHGANLECIDCHTNNAQTLLWPFAAYQPNCAGCHAGDYDPGPHKLHENPDRKYDVSDLRDCTGACHIYTDSTLTTIKDFRPGEHRVGDSNFD